MPESGRTIHFILNPRAGSGTAAMAGERLKGACTKANLVAVLHPTLHAGHATLIARSLSQSEEPVYAVGGDGTVREVAAGLIGGNAPLGIIPCGSGNGLARHLGIPMNTVDAFELLQTGRIIIADVLKAGDQHFFNIAGIGFDGLVAHAFHAQAKRGLVNYIKLIIRWYFKSSEFEFELKSDGMSHSGMAYMIAFANGSQYGNNAWIARGARLDDGKIDVAIVRKPSLLQTPLFSWQVMTGRVRSSSLVKFLRLERVRVVTPRPVPLHLDGEAAGHTAEVFVGLESAKLRLIVPKG